LLALAACARRVDHEAIELLTDAVAAFEELGDEDGARVARGNLAAAFASCAESDEERDRAISLTREQIAAQQRSGDPFDELADRMTLCLLLQDRRRLDEARHELRRLSRSIRNLSAFRLLPDLAVLAARQEYLSGACKRALVLAGAVEAVGRELGDPEPWRGLVAALDVPAVAAALDEEAAGRLIAEGRGMSMERVLDYLELVVSGP
jgi:hypothetical protein